MKHSLNGSRVRVRECLRIEARNLSRADEMQIGKVLRIVGFERKKKRVGDKLVWAYLSRS